MLCVKVAPVSVGWAVTCNAIENLMLFRSGAQAEDAARRLAQALAEAGEWVEIEVRMRDGARAARFICTPQGSDREGAQAAVQRLQMRRPERAAARGRPFRTSATAPPA